MRQLVRIFVLVAAGLTLAASCTAGPSATRTPSSQSLAALGITPCERPDIKAPERLDKPAGLPWYAPKAPDWPYPANAEDRAALTRYADCHSKALQAYVEAWLDGRADARLPDALIPWGTRRDLFSTFTLRDPGTMGAVEQWAVRSAHSVDFGELYSSFPDPNATYLVAPALLAPNGSRLIVDGAFPHARYFSAQMTPPFDPDVYHYDTSIGVGEVPIVDADIIPQPGHVNPFRVGADRKAARRDYRLTFDIERGRPVARNPAFRPPDFRAPGNRRVGGTLLFQGPWGHPDTKGGQGKGLFEPGQLWLRYYAPDRGRGPLAGVALPKMAFELKDGRRFFIQPDLDGFLSSVQATTRLSRSDAAKPKLLQREDTGWLKQAGIFESIVGGIAIGTAKDRPPLEVRRATRAYVNDLVRGVAGRGDDVPAPGDYDQSATSATHIDYLVRGMSLERNHVVVLTGRLPTFPDTRDGAARMAGAQMRYWSLTGYHVPQGWDFLGALLSGNPQGFAVQSVMDDEVILNETRDYAIVLSRAEERPGNASSANGVTWLDWGPSAEVSWTLRWMSVVPEWTTDIAPTHTHIGRRADFWSDDFDPRVTLVNDHSGALGRYQPRVHYMSRAAFEALGPDILQRLR